MANDQAFLPFLHWLIDIAAPPAGSYDAGMIDARTLTVGFLMTLCASASAIADDKKEPKLSDLVPENAEVRKLADGFKFTEGPVWFDTDGGYLLFSDIPANRIIKWTEKDGATTFREPSHQSNGNTLDREGRLITCEHQSRRVTRTGADGEVEVLVDQHDGKKLNSPNDVVVKSDGTIWFTDPPYGGHADLEQGANYIFRFDPETKKTTAVATVKENPNGLAFSPDEKKLYVADSGSAHDLTAFEVKDDGSLGEGKHFATVDAGAPDGIRIDVHGNVWCTAGDGVHVFSPAGKLLGRIKVPESPANLCFGGKDGKTLFLTARSGLYAVETNVTDAARSKE